MKSEPVLDSKSWLKTVFCSSLNLDVEFARLSILNFEISHITAMVIVFIEYAQLITQAILFNPSLYSDAEYSDDTFVRVAVFIAKLFSPGHFFEQSKTGAFVVIVLIATILITLFKLILLSYIIYIAKYKFQGSCALIHLWRWIFRLQCKVIYFFISSFWINTIFLIKDSSSFDVFGIGKKGTIALGSIIIALEFTLSVVLQLRYLYVLPTGKDLFSAKSNNCQIITLFQKVLIQIFLVALPTNTLQTAWIMSIFNLCFSILRSAQFYMKLPLYQIRALIFEGSLMASVLSINSVCLMQAIMRSLHADRNSILFTFVAWIIISILAVKVSFGFLRKNIVSILNDKNPEFFIHKMSFIKELQKFHAMPTNSTPKYDWYYFLISTVNTNLHKILYTTNNEDKSPSSDQDFNKLIISHLQHLSETFPRDSFIKLYLAYFYGLKLKYFGNAIRCIKESNLENNANRKIKLTAFLLIIKIQEISRSREQKAKINLNAYVDSLTIVNRLEERIFSQTDQQIQLYKEITSEAPNLANIFNFAQNIKSLRQKIEREINFILKETPEANITPLMLYAEYQLRINHSMKEHLYFQKLYQKKYQKFTKYFDKDGLDKHNAYQQTAAFLVLDTSKQDNGKILYCSKSMEGIYGGSSQLYVGTNISAYTLPSLRSNIAHLRASMSATGDRSLFQNVIETYGYHQKGYLVPINVFFDIFPVMTEGLYFMLMIRPYPISNDILLVRENGDIESPTQNIAERLGLPIVVSTTTNIKSLSKELAKINQAFNIVNSLDQQQKSQSTYSQPLASSFKEINSGGPGFVPGKESQPTLVFSPFGGANTPSQFVLEDEAREIVKLYSGEGGVVELTPFKDSSKPSVSYFCTVQPFRNSLRVISLKEINTQKNEHSDEIQLTQPESKEQDEEEFEDNRADFEFEDEKQAGWIPLETLNPQKARQPTRDTLGPTAAGETFPTMEDHLLSPKSNHGLLSPRSPTNNLRAKSLSKIPRNKKINEGENKHHVIIPEKAVSMASSQVSIHSKKQKIEEAFQAALAVKQYPRSWFCLFFMFYFGIAAIFGIQLSLKIFLEDDFSTFILKKQVLTDAQSRNYYLLSSQISLQLALDYQSGRITLGDFGLLSALGDQLFSNARDTIMQLETFNNNILFSSNLLEKAIQKTLFDQTVQIFNVEKPQNDQDYEKLNTIQATNSIIETGLKFFAYLAQKQIEVAQSEMSIFTKNALNDLIIQTENITSIFLASLANQTNDILDLLTTFLIAILVWVSCVILSFALIIRRLYQEEINNVLAVTKLNTQLIQKTLQSMISFQEKLQGSKKETPENNSDNEKSSNTKIDFKDQNARQALPKKPNCSGTRKKYVIYFARLLTISVTVALLASVNSVIIRNSLNSLQQLQTFIQFTYGTKVNAALSLISFMELFSSNNKSRIKHQNPLTVVENQIQVIQKVRIEALKDLTSNQDDFLTPKFETVVLGDACSLIGTPLNVIFCDIMAAYGKSSGLIYLMNTLEDILIDKRNQYIASNKTAEALKKIQFEQIDLVTSVFQLLSVECDLFSASLDQNIAQILNNAQRNRNWIFGAFTFQLVTQGVLFWIMVLSRLKEANNQFKNVLRTFPSSLVLSNFLLKIFLVKTSKGFLDLAIKSDL